MKASFLKSDFQPPTSNNPSEDLAGVGFKVGTQKGGGVKLTRRVTNQNPTDRQGVKAWGIPKICASGDIKGSSLIAIPIYLKAVPSGLRVK
jgi:hypothetical protein